MLSIVVTMSAVSVAACLVTLNRVIGWRRILRHSTLIDVAFTLLLGVFLAGTLIGALTAVLGGLIMALVLSAAKKAQALLTGTHSVSERPSSAPKGYDPSEYNADGWIYNQAPYA